ncbi:MAG: EutN/CcmL family microcompartment protein [Firmicutes bacterium]|nr:EutN/CcmL family microcompartment protein [Bacillota bacterium]
MFIAKVVGYTWATRKSPNLEGLKLLLVKPMDGMTGKLYGETTMAVDCKMGAGIGDIVLIMDEGNSARQILDDKGAPVRTIVAGIVDEVQSGGKRIKYH